MVSESAMFGFGALPVLQQRILRLLWNRPFRGNFANLCEALGYSLNNWYKVKKSCLQLEEAGLIRIARGGRERDTLGFRLTEDWDQYLETFA